MKTATQPILLALAMLAMCPASSDAFWFRGRKEKSELQKGADRVIRWPSPYLCADRQHVHLPMEQMIANGWRRQNLLGPHHYNEDSTELTQSGKLKVQWIMSQTPPRYRQVFIERSIQEGVTATRIATAQNFANIVARNAQTYVPPIADTHIVSEGRPAATVDFVNTQFRDNMPAPVLPPLQQGFNAN